MMVWKGVFGGEPSWRRRLAIRASALAGQKKGSLLTEWPTRSPLTAFFCLTNSKVAERRPGKVSSFKGASVAL